MIQTDLVVEIHIGKLFGSQFFLNAFGKVFGVHGNGPPRLVRQLCRGDQLLSDLLLQGFRIAKSDALQLLNTLFLAIILEKLDEEREFFEFTADFIHFFRIEGSVLTVFQGKLLSDDAGQLFRCLLVRQIDVVF